MTPRKYRREHALKLVKPEEHALIGKLAELPELLIQVAEYREPHRLTVWAEETCALFHRYYSKHRVVVAKNKDLTRGRLLLLERVRSSLALVFNLIGVSAPDKM
jgi:arginyl-tRNA synthetase